MKKCPYCCEEIQDDAIKCRYCKEFLEGEKPKVIEEKISKPPLQSKEFIFRYHAKDAKGKNRDGTIEGVNQKEAVSKLHSQGLFVISVKMADTEEKKVGKYLAEWRDLQRSGAMKWVIIIVAIAIIYSIVDVIRHPNINIFRQLPSTEKEPSTIIDLNTTIKFTGTQFIITNKNNFDWTNVKLKVNSGTFGGGGFGLKIQRMHAGETYTVGTLQFAKEDGTRFNPYETKVLNIFIWCDTPQGNGSWSGSWN